MKRKTPQGADGNLNKEHWLSTWQLMRVLHVIEQNERASFINTSQWKFKVKTSQQFKARENANWFWFESDWLKKSARFLARSQPIRTRVNTSRSRWVLIGFCFECEWSSKKRTSSRDQSRSKLRPKQSELLSTLIWTVLPLKIVDRNPEFHFNITTLCDWSWKLAPFSQPMRCIFLSTGVFSWPNMELVNRRSHLKEYFSIYWRTTCSKHSVQNKI